MAKNWHGIEGLDALELAERKTQHFFASYFFYTNNFSITLKVLIMHEK
jgi:hypothetical protein